MERLKFVRAAGLQPIHRAYFCTAASFLARDHPEFPRS
jgi:hypothetical protein